MAKLCHCLIKVNSLWLWWYCALVLGTEAYLMYRAVNRCKEYNELPWPAERKPVSELYAYISLIVVSVMCMPFFILTTICKIGNYASDGLRLGRDDLLIKDTLTQSLQAGGSTHSLPDGATQPSSSTPPHKSVLSTRLLTWWRHTGPLSHTFHIIAAFSLLLPHVLLDARKIQHGFLTPDAIWQNELAVFEEKETTVTRQFYSGSEGRGTDNSTAGESYTRITSSVDVASPEFINYVLSAIIYSLRYPSVFWYSKIAFSLVFSFLLILATVHYIVSYCVLTVAYKLCMNVDWFPGLSMVLSPTAVLSLFLLADLIVFVSSISVFNYGYLHYNEAHKNYIKRYRKTGRVSPPPQGCQGYLPHTIATVSLVMFVVVRGPMVYDNVTIYRNFNHNIALASIVLDVSYMLIWISVWFCFTIKQEWSFKILAFKFQSSLSLNDLFTIENDHVEGSVTNLTDAVASGHSATNMNNNKPSRCTTPLSVSTLEADVNQSVEGAFVRAVGGPTSVLRKSGERRSHNRVKFEDSMDEHDNPGFIPVEADLDATGATVNPQNNKPINKKRKRKLQIAARIHGNSNNEEQQPPIEESDVVMRRKVNRNIFGEYELSETPENTLKRNYRNSIRDKCGQYYRLSQEFNNPAAQSSPVLPPKNTEHSHDKPDNSMGANPLTDPLHPQAARPVRDQSPLRLAPSRKDRHPSPNRYPSPTRNHSPIRHPSPNRHHSPIRHPAAAAEFRANQDGSKLSFHSQADSAYSSNNQSSYTTTNSHNSINSSNHPHLPKKPPPRPLKERPIPPYPRTSSTISQQSRPLHIVTSKPDIGRRDSALPSSNETSSNDSQDNVLCSQV